jgi:hypothetical protein
MDDKPYFLITGCGSSGTRYVAKVFRTLGLSVEHERKGGQDGLSSWYCGIPKAIFTPREAHLKYSLPPYKAATWKTFPEGREVVVLHQTRHPLKVISTVQRYSKGSWQFIYRALDWRIDPEEPLLLRCMKYWLYWNEAVEQVAQYRYQIEEFEQAWPTICDMIRRPRLNRYFDKVKKVSTRTNSRTSKYEPRTWEDLKKEDLRLTEQIIIKGKEYGYAI